MHSIFYFIWWVFTEQEANIVLPNTFVLENKTDTVVTVQFANDYLFIH
jgi:hypothetical protein